MLLFLTVMIIIGLFVTILILKGMVRSLRETNKKLRTEAIVVKQRRTRELAALSGYLTQDPMAAYQLLQTHVDGAKRHGF